MLKELSSAAKNAGNSTVNLSKKAHKVTDGKKTTGMGVLYTLFQLFTITNPGVISPTMENGIEYGLGSGLFVTLGHKIWKNRKSIWQYIKKPLRLFKRLINGS